jgi:hypothetical protein
MSGLKVIGCVLSEGIKNKMLSSEAQPFIPISALTYFDSPTMSIMVVKGDTAATLTIPVNYATIVLEAREKLKPDFQFKSDYFHYSRRNAIPDLLKQILPQADLHGIVGSNRGVPSSTAAKAGSLDPLGYLYRLEQCTLMEESQMIMDIAQYDLHFLKPEFKYVPVNPDSTLYPNNIKRKIMRCSIKVRGSNESRPKILLGDTVRLRPVAEDIKPHPPFHMRLFELIGIIVSYKLINEMCIVEFAQPFLDEIIFRPDVSGRFNQGENITILNLINELRYHVRFTFERSGLAFTHTGDYILQK